VFVTIDAGLPYQQYRESWPISHSLSDCPAHRTFQRLTHSLPLVPSPCSSSWTSRLESLSRKYVAVQARRAPTRLTLVPLQSREVTAMSAQHCALAVPHAILIDIDRLRLNHPIAYLDHPLRDRFQETGSTSLVGRRCPFHQGWRSAPPHHNFRAPWSVCSLPLPGREETPSPSCPAARTRDLPRAAERPESWTRTIVDWRSGTPAATNAAPAPVQQQLKA